AGAMRREGDDEILRRSGLLAAVLRRFFLLALVGGNAVEVVPADDRRKDRRQLLAAIAVKLKAAASRGARGRGIAVLDGDAERRLVGANAVGNKVEPDRRVPQRLIGVWLVVAASKRHERVATIAKDADHQISLALIAQQNGSDPEVRLWS